MYIKKVALENIKAIDSGELDFCPDGANYAGWSVITGDNGAGKTALLKAISMAVLGPDQSRALVPDLRGWITQGASRGTVSVEVVPDPVFDRNQPPFEAGIEFVDKDGMTDIAATTNGTAVTEGPWAPAGGGWLTVGYGPFRRLYGSSLDAQRLMTIPGRIPRFATLFKEDATLAECEAWVKQLNYRQLEHRQDASRTLSTLLALLNDDFLRHGLRLDGVDSDGIWLRDKVGRVMPLADMSEGYRVALATLIDIFRHMVLAYGSDGLTKLAADGTTIVQRPAVVLIDEIDAHLHPAWQREIGFWLTQHFPLVQFIVTTHSPLVCQAADHGRIYHIPQPGDGEPPARLDRDSYEQIIRGRSDEVLLTPAFGLRHTRSPRAVQARQRRAELVAKRQAVGRLANDETEELHRLEVFAAR